MCPDQNRESLFSFSLSKFDISSKIFNLKYCLYHLLTRFQLDPLLSISIWALRHLRTGLLLSSLFLATGKMFESVSILMLWLYFLFASFFLPFLTLRSYLLVHAAFPGIEKLWTNPETIQNLSDSSGCNTSLSPLSAYNVDKYGSVGDIFVVASPLLCRIICGTSRQRLWNYVTDLVKKEIDIMRSGLVSKALYSRPSFLTELLTFS